MQNTSTGFIDLFVIPDTAVNTTTALTTPNISCPMTGAGNAVLNGKKFRLSSILIEMHNSVMV